MAGAVDTTKGNPSEWFSYTARAVLAQGLSLLPPRSLQVFQDSQFTWELVEISTYEAIACLALNFVDYLSQQGICVLSDFWGVRILGRPIQDATGNPLVLDPHMCTMNTVFIAQLGVPSTWDRPHGEGGDEAHS